MVPSLAPGQFPAAVHRWFARGEDWAVHPLLAGRMSEVLAAVDGRMKSREPGPIAAPLGAGRLVGELLDDPECLDPRATGRRPIVVRLAYAMGALTARDEDALLSALRRRALPSNPGVDQGLIVSADVRPMVAPAVPTPCPRRSPWKLVAALLSIPLIAVLCWRLANPRSGTPSRSGPAGKPGVKEIVPDDLTELARQYAKIDHPYVRFLATQPDALKRGRQPAEESYDTWRGRTAHAFTAANHPLPRKLRERVARWREPEPALAEACTRMRELRRRWDPAAQGRPTLIEEPEAFFEALTRPSGLPPREEFDHPANAFLWRLPRDPVAAGRTFDTEADLRAELRPLVQRLTGAAPQTPWPAAELVGRVERAMDYAHWREEQQERGAVFAEEGPAGAAVEDGLKRFGR
jgi:hypothetical protein